MTGPTSQASTLNLDTPVPKRSLRLWIERWISTAQYLLKLTPPLTTLNPSGCNTGPWHRCNPGATPVQHPVNNLPRRRRRQLDQLSKAQNLRQRRRHNAQVNRNVNLFAQSVRLMAQFKRAKAKDDCPLRNLRYLRRPFRSAAHKRAFVQWTSPQPLGANPRKNLSESHRTGEADGHRSRGPHRHCSSSVSCSLDTIPANKMDRAADEPRRPHLQNSLPPRCKNRP